MRLAILGASGPTGRLVISGAIERGHVVTAAARHLDTLRASDQLISVPTDVRDVDAVRTAVRGQDAVISAVGSRARAPGALYSTAGRNLVQALEEEEVRRLIVVSSGGVQPHDRGLPFWFRLAIPLLLRDLYRDMAEMERLVQASTLDWTIVRAAYLVDQPARGRFRVGDGANPPGGRKISRADLAGFLLDQLQDRQWSQAAPTVAY
jgi:putative NADH-flavin reductase